MNGFVALNWLKACILRAVVNILFLCPQSMLYTDVNLDTVAVEDPNKSCYSIS